MRSRRSTGRRKTTSAVRFSKYRKSYDPYDSHGEEDDGGCPHCHKRGLSKDHSDCCPRYIDPNAEYGHSDESDFEYLGHGTAPKRRSIKPLHPFGDEESQDIKDFDGISDRFPESIDMEEQSRFDESAMRVRARSAQGYDTRSSLGFKRSMHFRLFALKC